VCIYVYVYIYVCIYVYIYIYIARRCIVDAAPLLGQPLTYIYTAASTHAIPLPLPNHAVPLALLPC